MGLDLAIDYGGSPEMHRLCIDVLRPSGGIAIVAGEDPHAPVPATVSDFIRLEMSIHGCRGSNISDQQAVVRLLEQGVIHPSVGAVLKLSEIAKAHELLDSGQVTDESYLSLGTDG